MTQQKSESVDVVLVGAGIMSATLAVLLKELDPTVSLEIVELQDAGAVESSNPWNNAGTGHAGLCELNYTPQGADGSIDIQKALTINAQFEVSKQLWSYLSGREHFGHCESFLHNVPHLSFVQGAKSMDFLKKRFEILRQHHAFSHLEYSEDKDRMREWMPLMMADRVADEEVSATYAANGTDVNFGALTRQLLTYVSSFPNVRISYQNKVVGLDRQGAGWNVNVKDLKSGDKRNISAGFVFLGAGGAALPLLQMSGIKEGKGYGGFPISGQWLRTDNQELVKQHQAKVYSLAAVGAPPMSVPHLDTRVVDGKKSLLFGPYAGFTTKFLKYGSILDLPMSVRLGNIGPMLTVARKNMDLTRYLVSEVMQSMEDRLASLRRFYPDAKAEDWRLEIAGQRVQIIKKHPTKGGILQFGTELVAAQDGSLAALLGASPGASVTVSIMLDLLERCFPEKVKGAAWSSKLAEIFPARESALIENETLYREVSTRSDERLGLRY